MILRRSRADDIPTLQALWQEIFGDPPAFTGRFYETFGADCAIVAQEDEKVIAMIHPLPVALAQSRQYSFGVYIYALATHPDHRGKGIASQLLEAAETAPFPAHPVLEGADAVGLSARGSDTPTFSLLIPGEASLFGYYRTRGYDRTARVVSEISHDYPAHLAKGLSAQPIFLKPKHFFALSEQMHEPVPPPVEQGLWKAIAPHLADGEPTLSHFMQ